MEFRGPLPPLATSSVTHGLNFRNYLAFQDNATFLRGEKILKDIFYIQWNFGVKWALGGEIEKVAANLKQVAGRDERQRLLTGRFALKR